MPAFRHEVLCDDTDAGFAPALAVVIREALEAGSSIVVAASGPHTEAIRDHLGTSADAVTTVDLDGRGANPGRHIDLWSALLDAELASGRTLLGVSAPMCRERHPAELDECIVHEHLANLAFAGNARFRLVCACEARATPPDLVDAFVAAHPLLHTPAGAQANPDHRPVGPTDLLSGHLSPAGRPVAALDIAAGTLPALRQRVRAVAVEAGMGPSERVDDLVLAASEIAANSVLHGGGEGHMVLWVEDRSVWCQVDDGGHITDPLIGRRRARDEAQGGRGIWIAHQVCDLVQVRSDVTGTTVRMRMDLRAV